MKDLNKVINLEHENAESYMHIGNIYWDLEDNQSAINDYQELLS